MPIFFQHDIDEDTRLAIWKIEEEESFFNVPLQREITHSQKRQQHLAGRYLLKLLFPDFPIDLIRIADTRKPYLENEAYHFSISHCSHYAAAIVSRHKRVGVDIEVPSFKVERIQHKFLHPEESILLEESNGLQIPSAGRAILQLNGNLNPETPNPKLTVLWSAKEAVFKWWSYGGVDFSEMIRLQPFELQPAGAFDGCFVSKEKVWPLTLHYRLFDQICLAWVAS